MSQVHLSNMEFCKGESVALAGTDPDRGSNPGRRGAEREREEEWDGRAATSSLQSVADGRRRTSSGSLTQEGWYERGHHIHLFAPLQQHLKRSITGREEISPLYER